MDAKTKKELDAFRQRLVDILEDMKRWTEENLQTTPILTKSEKYHFYEVLEDTFNATEGITDLIVGRYK